MRYLTKSRFKMAVECPTKLSYTAKRNIYQDTSSDDDFLRGLAEGGYQVGELAKLMHPEGIEVNSPTHEEQVAETSRLLGRDSVTIFEGAISAGNLFARVDIIRKSGNEIELIEVKSKSYDPNDERFFTSANGNFKKNILPYLQDIAFQQHVFVLAFPELSRRVSSFLMLADETKICTADRLNQKFRITRNEGRIAVKLVDGFDHLSIGEPILAKINVDQYVSRILAEEIIIPGLSGPFDKVVSKLAAAYAADQKVGPVIGAHCAKCQFRLNKDDQHALLRSGIHECWQTVGVSPKEFDQGTVLDLWNYRHKDRLILSSKFLISDVEKLDINPEDNETGLSRSERQWMQVSGDLRGQSEFYIDHQFMRDAIRSWQYPLHFIDFETTRVAIPFTSGKSPYGNVAFQYSHHVMYEDGRVEHLSQFLNTTPGKNPNEEFIRQLMSDLGKDDGTVFMWSQHENTVLKDLLNELEENPPSDIADIREFIYSLTTDSKNKRVGTRAMYDLCVLAEKGFFHPSTNGSNSIKKVLPAVLSASKWLQNRYGKPIYGKDRDVPSLNFDDPNGVIWWVQDDSGIVNPYSQLPPVFSDIGNQMIEAGLEDVDTEMEVAEGAGAMMAYSRLQFENLSDAEREHIRKALLRYCELDTLAMVMIVEAWRDWTLTR